MIVGSLVTIATLLTGVLSATVEYNLSVDWVRASPDGYERSVVGINGAWPCPTLRGNFGDRMIITLYNNLGNETTSLHFHGLFQFGSNQMDGPVGITQCAIAPGSYQVYNFTLNQVGTYWYHSHIGGQYPDGLRGPLIIDDPNDPYIDQIDGDLVLTMSDWYHELNAVLESSFLSVTNPTGAEPVPNNGLLNDTQNLPFKVEQNKTYRIRLINIGAFASFYIWFENHDFQIVEVDGIYTEPQTASMIYITASQRYTILLTTKNLTSSDPTIFPFVGSMDSGLFDVIPDGLDWNVTGWLVYDDNVPQSDYPAASIIDSYDFYDDFNLVPLDHEPMIPDDEITQTLNVTVQMLVRNDGVNYAFFNDVSYIGPKVPTLMSSLSAPDDDTANDPAIYGTTTHPFVLEYNNSIEIIVNSQDPGTHPFHLHGHVFQAIERSDESGDDDIFISYDPANPGPRNPYPMRRDTFYVRPNGYFVIRFRADNPGIWYYHCHIEWHLQQGLALTIVEAPDQIRGNISQHLNHNSQEICQNSSTPYVGNAANHTDFADLTGQPTDVKPLPNGFIAKGIVAMVFSCFTAFLGMAFITWYGVSDIKNARIHMVADVVDNLGVDEITKDPSLAASLDSIAEDAEKDLANRGVNSVDEIETARTFESNQKKTYHQRFENMFTWKRKPFVWEEFGDENK